MPRDDDSTRQQQQSGASGSPLLQSSTDNDEIRFNSHSRSRSLSPLPATARDIATPRRKSIERSSSPSSADPLARRRLSSLRIGNTSSSPVLGSSPTAVPLHFRRPPPSPGMARSHSMSSPAAAAAGLAGVAAAAAALEGLTPGEGDASAIEASSDIGVRPASSLSTNTPRSRRERPRSTEFKSSTEFRPLWLIERHASAKHKKPAEEPEEEEALPSLPSSKTTSRNSSVEDLRAAANAGDDDVFMPPPAGDAWGGWTKRRPAPMPLDIATVEKRRMSADVLDSSQVTPTAESFKAQMLGEREREREKERKKYEFHSPSELLIEPQGATEHGQESDFEGLGAAVSEDEKAAESELEPEQRHHDFAIAAGTAMGVGAAALGAAALMHDKHQHEAEPLSVAQGPSGEQAVGESGPKLEQGSEKSGLGENESGDSTIRDVQMPAERRDEELAAARADHDADAGIIEKVDSNLAGGDVARTETDRDLVEHVGGDAEDITASASAPAPEHGFEADAESTVVHDTSVASAPAPALTRKLSKKEKRKLKKGKGAGSIDADEENIAIERAAEPEPLPEDKAIANTSIPAEPLESEIEPAVAQESSKSLHSWFATQLPNLNADVSAELPTENTFQKEPLQEIPLDARDSSPPVEMSRDTDLVAPAEPAEPLPQDVPPQGQEAAAEDEWAVPMSSKKSKKKGKKGKGKALNFEEEPATPMVEPAVEAETVIPGPVQEEVSQEISDPIVESLEPAPETPAEAAAEDEWAMPTSSKKAKKKAKKAKGLSWSEEPAAVPEVVETPVVDEFVPEPKEIEGTTAPETTETNEPSQNLDSAETTAEAAPEDEWAFTPASKSKKKKNKKGSKGPDETPAPSVEPAEPITEAATQQEPVEIPATETTEQAVEPSVDQEAAFATPRAGSPVAQLQDETSNKETLPTVDADVPATPATDFDDFMDAREEITPSQEPLENDVWDDAVGYHGGEEADFQSDLIDDLLAPPPPGSENKIEKKEVKAPSPPPPPSAHNLEMMDLLSRRKSVSTGGKKDKKKKKGSSGSGSISIPSTPIKESVDPMEDTSKTVESPSIEASEDIWSTPTPAGKKGKKGKRKSTLLSDTTPPALEEPILENKADEAIPETVQSEDNASPEGGAEETLPEESVVTAVPETLTEEPTPITEIEAVTPAAEPETLSHQPQEPAEADADDLWGTPSSKKKKDKKKRKSATLAAAAAATAATGIMAEELISSKDSAPVEPEAVATPADEITVNEVLPATEATGAVDETAKAVDVFSETVTASKPDAAETITENFESVPTPVEGDAEDERAMPMSKKKAKKAKRKSGLVMPAEDSAPTTPVIEDQPILSSESQDTVVPVEATHEAVSMPETVPDSPAPEAVADDEWAVPMSKKEAKKAKKAKRKSGLSTPLDQEPSSEVPSPSVEEPLDVPETSTRELQSAPGAEEAAAELVPEPIEILPEPAAETVEVAVEDEWATPASKKKGKKAKRKSTLSSPAAVEEVPVPVESEVPVEESSNSLQQESLPTEPIPAENSVMAEATSVDEPKVEDTAKVKEMEIAPEVPAAEPTADAQDDFFAPVSRKKSKKDKKKGKAALLEEPVESEPSTPPVEEVSVPEALATNVPETTIEESKTEELTQDKEIEAAVSPGITESAPTTEAQEELFAPISRKKSKKDKKKATAWGFDDLGESAPSTPAAEDLPATDTPVLDAFTEEAKPEDLTAKEAQVPVVTAEPTPTVEAQDDSFAPVSRKKSKKDKKKAKGWSFDSLEDSTPSTPAAAESTAPPVETTGDPPTQEEPLPFEEIGQEVEISTDPLEPETGTPAAEAVDDDFFSAPLSKKDKKKAKKAAAAAAAAAAFETVTQEETSEQPSTSEPAEQPAVEDISAIVDDIATPATDNTAAFMTPMDQREDPWSAGAVSDVPTPAFETPAEGPVSAEDFWGPVTSKKKSKKDKKKSRLSGVVEEVATPTEEVAPSLYNAKHDTRKEEESKSFLEDTVAAGKPRDFNDFEDNSASADFAAIPTSSSVHIADFAKENVEEERGTEEKIEAVGEGEGIGEKVVDTETKSEPTVDDKTTPATEAVPVVKPVEPVTEKQEVEAEDEWAAPVSRKKSKKDKKKQKKGLPLDEPQTPAGPVEEKTMAEDVEAPVTSEGMSYLAGLHVLCANTVSCSHRGAACY